MTRYSIKARLAEIGKRSLDVVNEIKARGYSCTKQQFSDAINSRLGGNKGDQICELADQIIREWER